MLVETFWVDLYTWNEFPRSIGGMNICSFHIVTNPSSVERERYTLYVYIFIEREKKVLRSTIKPGVMFTIDYRISMYTRTIFAFPIPTPLSAIQKWLIVDERLLALKNIHRYIKRNADLQHTPRGCIKRIQIIWLYPLMLRCT